MIIKILSWMTIFALGCGCSLIITFCVWGSFCLLEEALYSSRRFKTNFAAIKKFERFAELYYKAVKLVPDKEAQDRLKTQWEDELCLKK